MIAAPEYGFAPTGSARITWTTELAARHICADYGYTLYARDVTTPRKVRHR